jgi:hypothetical protein
MGPWSARIRILAILASLMAGESSHPVCNSSLFSPCHVLGSVWLYGLAREDDDEGAPHPVQPPCLARMIQT